MSCESTSTTSQTLRTALEWRYAVKKFDASKKIPAATWSAIEDALVLTPSSYGLQPWKFLVVQNPETRKQLRPHSWDQSQITDCSHLLVVLGKRTVTTADVDAYVNRICEVRGVPAEKLAGYRDMMIGGVVNRQPTSAIADWAARQCYIALGNAMTSAALLGVDTCPMEGLDPAKYDEILGLNGTPYQTLCCLACGYRASDDAYATAKKVRFEKAALIETI